MFTLFPEGMNQEGSGVLPVCEGLRADSDVVLKCSLAALLGKHAGLTTAKEER